MGCLPSLCRNTTLPTPWESHRDIEKCTPVLDLCPDIYTGCTFRRVSFSSMHVPYKLRTYLGRVWGLSLLQANLSSPYMGHTNSTNGIVFVRVRWEYGCRDGRCISITRCMTLQGLSHFFLSVLNLQRMGTWHALLERRMAKNGE